MRLAPLIVLLLAVCAISGINASTTGEKLKTRVRISAGSTDAESSSTTPVLASAGSVAVPSSSAGATLSASAVPSAGSAAVPSAGSAVTSESSVPNSLAATPLQVSESSTGCEESSACGGIQWGSVSSSSNSGRSGSGSESDSLPPMDEVVGPIAQWLKAFKKRIGSGSGDDLATAAKEIVRPLIEKLKKNQREAEEKLEQSNEAILANVEKSATEHVLKLLKIEKKHELAREHSEAKKEKKEALHDELSGHEGSSLSSEISHAASELSHSHDPHSKSVLEHVSKELSKAKQSMSS